MHRWVFITWELVILVALGAQEPGPDSPETVSALHPDDFWVQHFENKNATFSPVVEHTSTLYKVISQSVVERKPALGKRCAKAEYVFKRRGYFYLRIVLGSTISVGDTGYFSCRFKSTGAGFSGIYVHGKLCDSVEDLPEGWKHIASNRLRGEIKSLAIRFNPVSEGAKLTLYLDDLRVSRSRTLLPPTAEEFARLSARWLQIREDLPALLGRVKDERLKRQLEEESRKLESLVPITEAPSLPGLSRGKFAGTMQEFEKAYWKAKWKVFIE